MKKYFNFKDKRAITLLVIAIITLLSLIIGATYAYFIASENNLTTSRTLEVTTNNTTSVVATGNTTLKMDLNLDDMRKFGTTKTYYATRDGKTENETEEDFINIQSTSSTKIYCTYTAELTKNDTENYSNMIDQIITNGKEDEMVLTFLYNGVVKNTFDMKTAKWDSNNKIKFTGILSDIEPNGSAVVDAKLYLRNLANVDQAPYLAQSALNLQMQLTNVNCDTMDTPMITSITKNEDVFGRLDVTMNEGSYELASYCVDQVERSTGECENWIPNNDKTFTALLDVLELGTYYLHVKDIRGYIADSAGFDVALSEEPVDATPKSYGYTGAAVSETLTPGYYKFEVWGAQGGNGQYSSYIGYGGKGGYSMGFYHVTENTVFNIFVGNSGGNGAGTGTYDGGWNGGGNGNYYAGGGGGATDIRLNGTALTDRIIIAGGGGGGNAYSSYRATGGSGGGAQGGFGTSGGNWTTDPTYRGYPGDQSSGGINPTNWNRGSLGQGAHNYSSYCGGGGGGYYGGACGGYYGVGGGGGSGYIGGVASSVRNPKHMNCFGCSENTDKTIRTHNVSVSNTTATSDTPKDGQGYAIITPVQIYDLVLY